MSTLNIEEAGRGRFRCTDEDGRVFVLTGRELKHAGVQASEGTAPVEDGAYAELLDYLYRKALARCGNRLSGMD